MNWETFLAEEQQKDYFVKLQTKVDAAREQGNVYPPKEDIYSSLKLCPFDDVKVVIVGQDPYHGAGQAHGLSFSVKPGVKVPPSLKNIYKELKADLNVDAPNHGYLVDWAKQGVLMLNTSWTVTESKAGSHKSYGWMTFTKNILALLNQSEEPIVFLLWGNHAIDVAKDIDNPKHLLLKSAHPSPLAGGAFFGNHHFSKANEFLKANDRAPINWQLCDIK